MRSFRRVVAILPTRCRTVCLLSDDVGGGYGCHHGHPDQRGAHPDRRGGGRGGGVARLPSRHLRLPDQSWADALFELSDAVLCAPGPVVSVPTLSLEPTFRRSHGRLYKALARGSLDADRLRDTLVAHRPADWPAIFAVDASSWPRCDAETSPERGFYYHPSRHSNGQPIVAG